MPDLPEPEVGLVLSHLFLWSAEHAEGREEGRKPRPAAVVTVVATQNNRTTVYLSPITSQPPADPTLAVEIPSITQNRLGLRRRSWIMADELNAFDWPGFDLVPNTEGNYVYGVLPYGLVTSLRSKILQCRRDGLLSVVDRN